ncbi:hypothetical protein EHO98_23085 [Leptospira stimsonii]|uniref:Cytotoxic translational repressor of toxin-antitoxin stability system n=1 Tax=Leptospira stimsonii TaxID=2202203 RepID=A0ABY2N5Q0_9LEPT|nr:hypothetical protein EHO98_23085 [Leptospira stimsonii]TGM17260.1 hypothetical protein EHQ90_07710 [Leptospira stimsonii]
MKFLVSERSSASKSALKMPKQERNKYLSLLIELEALGPIRKNWPNFSALGKDKYHCHLSRKWVACWTSRNGSIEIEVYYAGSRENAPY